MAWLDLFLGALFSFLSEPVRFFFPAVAVTDNLLLVYTIALDFSILIEYPAFFCQIQLLSQVVFWWTFFDFFFFFEKNVYDIYYLFTEVTILLFNSGVYISPSSSLTQRNHLLP